MSTSVSTHPEVFSLDLVELPAIHHFLIISKECPSTNNLLHKYSSAHLNVLWMCVGVLWECECMMCECEGWRPAPCERAYTLRSVSKGCWKYVSLLQMAEMLGGFQWRTMSQNSRTTTSLASWTLMPSVARLWPEQRKLQCSELTQTYSTVLDHNYPILQHSFIISGWWNLFSHFS